MQFLIIYFTILTLVAIFSEDNKYIIHKQERQESHRYKCGIFCIYNILMKMFCIFFFYLIKYNIKVFLRST